jgi:hypothetical protein
MTNAWITHAKQFASAHHMKYGDALKNPHCKASYQKQKMKGGMLRRIYDRIRGRPTTADEIYDENDMPVANAVIRNNNTVAVRHTDENHQRVRNIPIPTAAIVQNNVTNALTVEQHNAQEFERLRIQRERSEAEEMQILRAEQERFDAEDSARERRRQQNIALEEQRIQQIRNNENAFKDRVINEVFK